MRKPLMFALFLTGCVNDGPGDPNFDIAKSMNITSQNMQIGYRNRCLALGAEPSSDVFSQCVTTLAEADRQAEQLRAGEEKRMGERRPMP